MKIYALIILTFFMSCSTKGQKEDVDVITKITQALNEKYVDKAVALEISNLLLANQKLGKYDSLQIEALISNINTDMRSVVNDRHIQLVNIKNTKKLPWNKSFILDVKILEGNIGYLHISHFPEPGDDVYNLISSAFNLLKNADGIIVDLRDNGGGYPDVVSEILGYFLEGSVEYDKFYVPSDNKTFKYTSHKKVVGEKLVNKPLKVIVNEKTASSGELLALAMQNLKLGKVYGTTTMGLVNLSEYFPINDSIYLLASKGIQQNPFINGTIENIGVIPDFSFDSKTSLKEAHLDLIEDVRGKQFRNWISEKLDSDEAHLAPLLADRYVGKYESIIISKEYDKLFYQDASGFKYEMVSLTDSTFSLKTNSDDRFRLIFKTENEGISLVKRYFDGTEDAYQKSSQ